MMYVKQKILFPLQIADQFSVSDNKKINSIGHIGFLRK